MKNFYKVAGIIAGIAFGIGLVCLMIGIACGTFGTIILGEDGFRVKDDTKRWQYANVEETPFMDVDIQTRLAKIHIIESDTEEYKVSLDLTGSESDYIFTNENGVLTIKDKAPKNQFSINIFQGVKTTTDVIYISIPKDIQLNNVTVKSDVGDIEMNISAGAKMVTIAADVGEIHIEKGEYEKLELSADVGDIELKNVNVTSKIKADANVGEINISGALACDMDVNADVGSVSIETDYSKDMYRYQVSADMGEIEVFGKKYSGAENEVDGNDEGEYLMIVEASVGSVEIESTAD